MGITVKQIAEIAGVSRGTVDRVLHNRGRVDPATLERVRRVIEQEQFKPNSVAKALKHSEKQLRLGVIETDIKNPFWNVVMKGFRDAEREYTSSGVTLVKISMNSISAQEQLRCMMELCEGDKPVDGLFLSAINDPSISEYINNLPNDLPVITYNSDIMNTKRLCFVGQNHYDAGQTAGRLFSMLLMNRGKVVTFSGTQKTLAHINRYNGMRDELKKLEPNIDIEQPVMHAEDDDVTYVLAKEILRDPEISAVYCTGEGSSGVAKALAESGRRPEVKMICFDLLPGVIKGITDEVVDFSISQEEYLQGYLPVKIMYDYKVFNKKPIMQEFYTAIDIRVPENVRYISVDYLVRKSR